MSNNRIAPEINEINYDKTNILETGIGPVTDRFINTAISRFTNGNFKEVVTEKVINPVSDIIYAKARPYIYISVGLYAIVILLLVIIIYLLIRLNIK